MSLFSLFHKNSASDQSRIIKIRTPSKYAGSICGLLIGFTYAAMEWWFDHHGVKTHRWLFHIHEDFDWVLPIVLGTLSGTGFTFYQRNKLLSTTLSTQNNHLRSRLLANTLLAHVLHEIRNPIHNLNALLERSIDHFSPADREIVERNITRLDETMAQLKRMSGSWDTISARQPVHFSDWLKSFLEQSVLTDLTRSGISYSENIEPMILHMHPLLLEQTFTVLLQNARQACETAPGKNFEITIRASFDDTQKNIARIEISNTGNLIPETVLLNNAKRAVRSSSGMGMGLVLARDTLESVGGTLKLLNQSGRAIVVLSLPAERES